MLTADSTNIFFRYRPQWAYDTIATTDTIEQATTDSAVGSFFGNGGITLIQIDKPLMQPDWITFLIIGLVTGVAVIWYFLPERLTYMFSVSEKDGYFKPREKSVSASPGAGIRLYFILNFLATQIIFIYLAIKFLMPSSFLLTSGPQLFLVIGGVVLLVFIYRFWVVKITGFIFDTSYAAKQQNRLNISTDNALGVLLLPVLILMLYPMVTDLVYIGILLIFMSFLTRGYYTFQIGKKLGDYSWLHLFMYLCALEIIPLLVLIKLLKNLV